MATSELAAQNDSYPKAASLRLVRDVIPQWEQFITTHHDLELSIQNLQNSIQELSSSMDLSISLQNLSDSVAMVSWVLQSNISHLFPEITQKIRLPYPEGDVFRHTLHSSKTVPVANRRKMQALHQELAAAADDLGNIKKAIMNFSEFRRSIHHNWSIEYIEKDFRYWASCLSSYSDDYTLRGVRFYISDLSREIELHYKEMSSTITGLTHRVPAVLASQNRMLNNLRSLSTMATFFSGVTATVLQYSFEDNSSGLSKAVNAFWFGSLVFSVTGALTGFLAYTWRKSMYSSKRSLAWTWTWIHISPVAFLIMSVVSFLCGLTCFSISTQTLGTQIVVLLCVGTSILSAAPLLFWLGTDMLRKFPSVQSLSTELFNVWEEGHVNEFTLPMFSPDIRNETQQGTEPRYLQQVNSEPVANLAKPSGFNEKAAVNDSPGIENLISNLPLSQLRLRRVVIQLILRQRIINMAKEKRLVSELEQTLRKIKPVGNGLQFDELTTLGYPSFKPDGSALALATPIRSVMYELDNSNVTPTLNFDSRLNFIGIGVREVTWASHGDCILTWIPHGANIDIWHKASTSKRVERERTIKHIQPISLPREESNLPRFLVVDGFENLTILDTEGREYPHHEFSTTDIIIHHLDTLHSRNLSQTLIVMAVTMRRSTDHIRPIHALPMRKLIVFDLVSGRVQCDVPLWRDVQYVSTCSNHGSIAVSYGDEAPHIWTLETRNNKHYLSLHRELSGPSSTTKFQGRAQWLNNSQFLLCLTTDGDICFWRRDREQPVHLISNEQLGGGDKIIKVACKSAGNDFMFATISEQGITQLWRVPDTSLFPDTSDQELSHGE